MIRKASIMYVYKDQFDEYRRRHDEIWPEMVESLKQHGAHNYSIFLEKETGKLFTYLEVEDEDRWKQMAKSDICKKWWAYMEPLMETNPDNSPLTIDLKEVFYLA
ncbi:L-rhamnose mutarotase [Priestia aryabhattai]|uniref:L-rhamnose mutarotase n=1 Tax=Priestia aryabhattai TaxID=412384 RepID=UPI001CCA58E1|nr:L-rhamnose mutarotase [Priestia aryabhattai]MBZ6489465.1 L-rhamnose mutarotase [Priestia aryabhattai]